MQAPLQPHQHQTRPQIMHVIDSFLIVFTAFQIGWLFFVNFSTLSVQYELAYLHPQLDLNLTNQTRKLEFGIVSSDFARAIDLDKFASAQCVKYSFGYEYAGQKPFQIPQNNLIQNASWCDITLDSNPFKKNQNCTYKLSYSQQESASYKRRLFQFILCLTALGAHIFLSVLVYKNRLYVHQNKVPVYKGLRYCLFMLFDAIAVNICYFNLLGDICIKKSILFKNFADYDPTWNIINMFWLILVSLAYLIYKTLEEEQKDVCQTFNIAVFITFQSLFLIMALIQSPYLVWSSLIVIKNVGACLGIFGDEIYLLIVDLGIKALNQKRRWLEHVKDKNQQKQRRNRQYLRISNSQLHELGLDD